MSNKLCSSLCLALLICLLANCGTASPSAVTLPPTPKPTPTLPPVSTPLVGTYTTTITAAEISATHNSRIAFEVQAGGWTLVLRSDGYYTATTGYHPYGMSYVGEGSYSINGNQFLSKDGNCWEYFGDAGHFGTFTWSLQDKHLVFQVVHDQCLSRAFVFTIHHWIRQG